MSNYIYLIHKYLDYLLPLKTREVNYQILIGKLEANSTKPQISYFEINELNAQILVRALNLQTVSNICFRLGIKSYPSTPSAQMI